MLPVSVCAMSRPSLLSRLLLGQCISLTDVALKRTFLCAL